MVAAAAAPSLASTMFDTVLVGVDGRQGGHDAIALARLLAAPAAAVTFSHVYDLPTAGGRAAAVALPLELEAAERLLRREAMQAPLLAEAAAVRDSSVGRGLHRLAEQRRAELLVVGSCHRGMFGRVLLGDDTSGALNGAPCAVAIAPHGYAASGSHRLERIGVGYDLSPESASALQVARALAAHHRSKIKALSVVSLQSIPYGEAVPEQWPSIAGQLVADERHRLSKLEGVEGDATYGDPSEELAALSADLDLLVVGSRGYGPVGRLFNGSTSNYLGRRSRCPLLVLPRGAARPRLPSDSDPKVAAAPRA